MEDQNVDGNVDSKGWAPQILTRSKDFIWNWAGGSLRCMLAKKLTELYWCLEILSEIELKSNGLHCLLEEISEQHNIQAVALLLLTAFTQIYSETAERTEKIFKKHSFARTLNVIIVTDRMGKQGQTKQK